jgi:integrase
LVAHLERGEPGVKTYNNRRGLLSTFLKFALRNDWLSENPINRTPHYRINHRRGSPKTLGANLAAELMAFVEQYNDGAMVPYFSLCLFAGIRPCIRAGEISKLRPTSINLQTNVIYIEPEVSKERAKRHIRIQPNLSTWLRAYPPERYPIIPRNAAGMRQQICMKFGLTHDVLRHTFISMFVAKFRSIGEAALQGGNSEGVIRKHYLELKCEGEAERFFSIAPKLRGDRS